MSELEKLKQQIKDVREVCNLVLDISPMDRLYGEHLTGKYHLAEDIIAIIGDEDD